MSDSPNENVHWRIPKPTLAHFLGVALALSLAFSGYLIARPDVGSAATSNPSDLKPGTAAPQTPAAESSTPLAPSDINTLIVQMQDMQKALQAMTNQLDQKSQAMGLNAPNSPMKTPLPTENVPALWAEIEHLNQVMQPLMVQLEIVTANRSSRSASELAALRTQVNTIHQRLAYLLARVEAAKSQNNLSKDSNSFSTAANRADQVTYEQLYQTMLELQNQLNLLQQNQSTYPGFHP
jgi:hypothetical protein